jgi:hypothetical protein
MLKLLVVAVVAALAAPAAAGAATIHTPADGLITQQGQPVYFDWAWDFDESATASIVLTRSSEPTSPLWQYGPTVPASADRQAFSDCSYGVCSPWLDSHATLTFDTTAPGDWWWRLCNKSINGEDDKCSYDSAVAPRKLTLTAKPAPPPDLCTDGLDNDGDGKTDLDDMDNDNANDTKLWCDQIKPAAKPAPTTRPALLPRLTVSDAKSYIRTVLKRRFGDAYRYAQARGSHAVTGAHAPRCGAMSSSSPAT